MKIEARLNDRSSEACVVCRAVRRNNLEPSLVYRDENDDWVCGDCAAGGADGIRDKFYGHAEHLRERARRWDKMCEQEIVIVPVSEEVQRELAAAEADWGAAMAELHRTGGGRYAPYVLGRDDEPLEQAVEDY